MNFNNIFNFGCTSCETNDPILGAMRMEVTISVSYSRTSMEDLKRDRHKEKHKEQVD